MRKITIYIILVLLAFSSLTMQGAYLHKVPLNKTQPDGLKITVYATGDEFHNWLHDKDDFTIIQDPNSGFYVYAQKSGSKLVPTPYIVGRTDPGSLGIQPGLNIDQDELLRFRQERFRVPSFKGATVTDNTGLLNNIVVFIRFSDQEEYSTEISAYNSAFNDPGTTSMTEFFKEVSASQLTITSSFYPVPPGSTVVSYQDSNPRDYYVVYHSVTNPIGYQNSDQRTEREMTLLKNATESVATELENSDLDFDYNGDGNVDNVVYIVQGDPEGWSELLWPHKWSLFYHDVRIKGLRVWEFNFQLSKIFSVSTCCHEMSHSLGFPDLYHYTTQPVNPVGYWDVMSYHTSPPQHHGVYTKDKYGKWLSGLPEITSNGAYTLYPLSSDPFAGYKISSPNSSSEFFVVEYRRAEGMFESRLPGSGLIIYRVKPDIRGNSNGPPDEVYIFRPGGTTTVNGDISNAFFSSESGRTMFTASSNPSCFLGDGSPGGIEITDIGSAGETISFTVNLNPIPPVLAVTPDSHGISHTGGTRTFSVSNLGDDVMPWTASVTSGSTWARITSGVSGTNSGSIVVEVDPNLKATSRTAAISITANGAQGSPKTVTIVQEGNPAVLVVSPDSRELPFTGGVADFSVGNLGGGNMDWLANVTSGSSWAHITSGSSGTNAGTINLTIDANPNNAQRTAEVTVAAEGASGSPKKVSIVQAANTPVLVIDPSTREIGISGGTTTFTVNNSGGGDMVWTAALTGGSGWARITGGSQGTNTGTVNLTIDPNPDNATRTASLTVTANGAIGSPKTVTIVQAANPPILIVTPDNRTIPLEGGTATFSVTNSGGGQMAWSATLPAGLSWARIVSGSQGTNEGTINLTIDRNPDDAQRTAVVTIVAGGAGGSPKTVSIIQAANLPVLTVAPLSREVPFTGEVAEFSVGNSGGGSMTWTAAVTTGSTWAHITQGVSGTNTGTIRVTVDLNTENAVRSAVVTVSASGATGSPKLLTLIQAANPPLLSVMPNQQEIGLTGGTLNFSVNNLGGGVMSWTSEITSGSSFTRLTSGSSGTNAGTIQISVDSNPTSEIRTAEVTILAPGAGNSPKKVSVIQAANPPVLTVAPLSREVPLEGGVATFEITNTGGDEMAWNAEVTQGTSWAQITSGSSGSNTGTINVILSPNTLDVSRTAVITITAAGAAGSPKTVTIVQAANPRVLSVTPEVFTVAYSSTIITISVRNFGGGTMDWYAVLTSGSEWITINSGSTGSNSGEIIAAIDFNPNNNPRSAVLTVTAPGAIGSPKIISIVQTANPPVLSALPVTRNLPFNSGSTFFEIANTGGGTMLWNASVTDGGDWAHILSGSAGSNSGIINISFDYNPYNVTRTAVIKVNATGAGGSPATLIMTQAANPPVLSVEPMTRSIGLSGGLVTYEVTNTGGGDMSWTAAVTGGNSWAQITAGSAGSNTGTISVNVPTNPDNSVRTALLAVTAPEAGNSPIVLTLVQAANPPVLSVYPVSRSIGLAGGPVTFDVTNTGGGTMDWSVSVTEGAGWIQIDSGSSGSNSGTISVHVDPNPDDVIRTAALTVVAAGAGGSPATILINQAAWPPVLSVSSDSLNIPYTGGTASFDITNSGGGSMVWSATVSPGTEWLQIINGSSGTDGGTVFLSVGANPDQTSRNALITVVAPTAINNPQEISIYQEPKPLLKPDLTVNHLETGTEVNSTEQVRVILKIGNKGDGPSNSTATGFYLSEDSTMIKSVSYLGELACDPISNGAELAFEFDLSIGDTLKPGIYYLIAIADALDFNDELDEENNAGSFRLSVINSVDSKSGEYFLKVYPVPADLNLIIRSDGIGPVINRVTILDILGRPVWNQNVVKSASFYFEVQVSTWTKGCYWVLVESQNQVYRKMVIVQ